MINIHKYTKKNIQEAISILYKCNNFIKFVNRPCIIISLFDGSYEEVEVISCELNMQNYIILTTDGPFDKYNTFTIDDCISATANEVCYAIEHYAKENKIL